MNEVDPSGFFTVREFSNKLKIHPNTVRRAIKKGRIQAIRLGEAKNACYRIPFSELSRIGFLGLQHIIDKMIAERLNK